MFKAELFNSIIFTNEFIVLCQIYIYNCFQEHFQTAFRMLRGFTGPQAWLNAFMLAVVSNFL